MCDTRYKWCEDQNIVHEEGGKKYCAFHSPRDEKGDKKGVSFKVFQGLVFKRLNEALEKKETCDLSGTIFPDEFDFSKVNKEQRLPSVSFIDAKFGNETSFNHLQFSGKTFFSYVKFSDNTSFNHAKFSDNTSFIHAEFGNETSFWGAILDGETDFIFAKFGSETSFTDAKFGGETSFTGAKFGSETFFTGAKFGNRTDYGLATFGDMIYFFDAKFSNDSDFNNAKFKKALIQGETFSGEVNFRNITVEEKLTLKDVNLKKARFLGAQLKNICFETCEWDEEEYGRIRIYDETDVGIQQNVDIKHIEEIYRILKIKYKDYHNETYVSKFHASEMLMLTKRTRLNIKKPSTWFYYPLLHSYKFSSGYGENPARAFYVLLSIFLAALITLGSIGFVDNNKSEISIASPENIFKVGITILENFTFQKDLRYKINPESDLGAFLKVFFNILTIVQTTLFLFALRNRFRR